MTKANKISRRSFWATPEGFHEWELYSGLSGPNEAHKALGITLRTYCRYKSEGIPNKLQREVVLDRMEKLAGKKWRG